MTYAPHGTRWVTSALIYLLILAVAGVVYYSLYIAGQEEHLGKRAQRSLSYVGAGISRSLETLKTSADTVTLTKSLLCQINTYRDMGSEQEAKRKLQELANQAKLNPRYRHLEAFVCENRDLAGTLEKTGDVWKFAICGDKGPADKGPAVGFEVWLKDLLNEVNTDALEDFDQVVVASPNGEILHVAEVRDAEGRLWPPPPNTRDEFSTLVSVDISKSRHRDTNAVSNETGKPVDDEVAERSENRDRPAGADSTDWVRRLFGETGPTGGRILSSRAKELDLGGRRFTVFLHPHLLPLRYRLGEEPAEFESVYIIGLVASERWLREKLIVAPTTLGLLSTAVAVVMLSFPLIKLWTKGAHQHTARSEAYALAVATLIGVGFIAILFVDRVCQWRNVQEFDNRLYSLSKQVSSEFGAEFQDKLGYMGEVVFPDDASTSDWAGEGVSDHTSEAAWTRESGGCEWASMRPLSADGWSRNDPPPMTEMVFRADHEGNQWKKRLSWRDTDCDWKPNVKERDYFHRARDGRDPVVDRVFALDTGRPTGVMAMPREISESAGDPGVITMAGDFASLRWRLLPPGFEYAVVKSDTGEVVYHAREHRSLIENLVEETNNDLELVAALKGGRPGFLDLDYHHWEYRGYIAPLGQDTGWSLLVMYDKQLRQIPAFEALALAVGQFVAFAVAVMVFLVLFALMARWRRRPEASWRRLNRDHPVLVGWLCVIAVLPGALSSWSAWSLQDRTWNKFTYDANVRNTTAWETAFGKHMRHVYRWGRSKPEFEPILSYMRRYESKDGERAPEALSTWDSPAAVLARSLPAYSHLSSFWHLSYHDSESSIVSALQSSGPAVVVGTVLPLGLLAWLLVAGVVRKLTVAERHAFQPTRYLPHRDSKVILVGVFEEGMKLLESRLALHQKPLVADAATGTFDYEAAGDVPVIVSRFDEALADPAAHPKALDLLKRLRDRPGPVMVASAVDPYYWFTSIHTGTGQTVSAVPVGEFSARWYRVLGGFQVLRACDIDLPETYRSLPQSLQKALRGFPDLAARADAIKAQCDPDDLDDETMGRCVLKQARGLYQRIWIYSSDDEKLALHHLANGALVNPRDRETLHSLFTRGLIDGAAVFEITNRSFRSFVQAAERPERWVEFEKAQDPGMWGSVRGPLTLVIVLALPFLAYVYQEQYSVMLALLGSIPAVLPALERMSGLLGVPAARAETKGV